MTRKELANKPKWLSSDFVNEEYFLEKGKYEAGCDAYVYDKGDDTLTHLIIIHSILRSDDPKAYDSRSEWALIDGDDEYGADHSCEFITDDDCMLVWFENA